MLIKFYKTKEKTPPKDGTVIIGFFEGNINTCYFNNNVWCIEDRFYPYYKKDPVLWIYKTIIDKKIDNYNVDVDSIQKELIKKLIKEKEKEKEYNIDLSKSVINELENIDYNIMLLNKELDLERPLTNDELKYFLKKWLKTDFEYILKGLY